MNQTKVVMISSDENSSGSLLVTQNIAEPLFKVEKVPSNNSRSLGSHQSASGKSGALATCFAVSGGQSNLRSV